MSPTNQHTISKLPIHHLSNGHRLELTVHEVSGTEPGPTVGILSTIHGDEPLGIEIIRRMVTELGSTALRGKVLLLPVANPYALQALTRNTPLDMTNLNRIFPGDPDGTLTEQLAHVITSSFLPRCEYLIDLHSGGNQPTVDYAYIHDQGADLSRAYGLDLLFRGSSYPGSLGKVARDQGIPTIVSELGGGQQRDEHFVNRGLRGIRNVLRSIGLLQGAIERPAKQLILNQIANMHPHQGGLLLSEVSADQLGSSVPKGTVLGRVISPYTFEELETITAPFDPSILVLVRQSVTRIEPGDYMYMIGNGETAEEVLND